MFRLAATAVSYVDFAKSLRREIVFVCDDIQLGVGDKWSVCDKSSNIFDSVI